LVYCVTWAFLRGIEVTTEGNPARQEGRKTVAATLKDAAKKIPYLRSTVRWIRGSSGNSAVHFARVGPVHFQPLEMELEPLSRYIRGRTLNAGCGSRDISDILRRFGATEVVNYDIESEIPGALIGSLEKTPFDNNSFDSIISNAVLEHVPNVHRVMDELYRVLKPGGHLIAAIPFLQPMHLSPTDYRRYTSDGLKELGALHNLSTAEVLPVHTIAQTLGWIAWEWALESQSRILIGIVYSVVWLWTRLSYRTDATIVKNANTFQIIYFK
jgi:SAM-dependent methyltransferase